MNTREILSVKKNLALLGRTRSELSFAYSASGYDHTPFLLTDSAPLNSQAILELLRRSFSKKILQGTISRNQDGSFCFSLKAGTSEADLLSFVSELSDGFVDQLPFLARSAAKIED